MGKAKTLGELRASGYEVLPVRAEMRNLIAKLRRGEALFPGIVDYDETVIPQIVTPFSAGRTSCCFGERGQAKSRLVRGLTAMLDEETAVLKRAEIAENPFRSRPRGVPSWPKRATRGRLPSCPQRRWSALFALRRR